MDLFVMNTAYASPGEAFFVPSAEVPVSSRALQEIFSQTPAPSFENDRAVPSTLLSTSMPTLPETAAPPFRLEQTVSPTFTPTLEPTMEPTVSPTSAFPEPYEIETHFVATPILGFSETARLPVVRPKPGPYPGFNRPEYYSDSWDDPVRPSEKPVQPTDHTTLQIVPTPRPSLRPSIKPTHQIPDDGWPAYFDSRTDEPTESTEYPTDVPLEEETDEPSHTTIHEPTHDPTEKPTEEPTEPGEDSTDGPTDEPTNDPTDKPTHLADEHAVDPTYEPTGNPVNAPVNDSPVDPTDELTGKPTNDPTNESVVGSIDTSIDEPVPDPTERPNPMTAEMMAPVPPNSSAGFQSGWGASTSGSMIYDVASDSVYVAGMSVSSDAPPACFVEAFSLDSIPLPTKTTPELTFSDSLGNREILACLLAQENDESGSTDKAELPSLIGGIFNPEGTATNGDDGKIQAILNLLQDRKDSSEGRLINLETQWQNVPGSFEEDLRQSVAMTSGKEFEQTVIALVSMSSVQHEGSSNHGSGSQLSFNEYEIDEGNNVIYRGGEDFSSDSGTIVPTGIGNVWPGFREYVFVGHRKGLPPREWFVEDPDDGQMDDFDGFSTAMIDGDPISMRFSSIERDPALDDFVHGLCMPPAGPDGKTDSYYVFGSTYGTMPIPDKAEEIKTNIRSDATNVDKTRIDKLSAWISKIDARERSVLWTTQIYATTEGLALEGGGIEAFGCHVIDQDPTQMYVGGNVYDGGVATSFQNHSAGSDDVWVAKLSTDDGSIRWMRQIGSSGKDRIAPTNGVASDKNGHCIVYGETNGDLYRKRSGDENDSTTDIFLTILDKEHGLSEPVVSISSFDALPERTKHPDRIFNRETILLIMILVLFVGIVLGLFNTFSKIVDRNQHFGIDLGERSSRRHVEDAKDASDIEDGKKDGDETGKTSSTYF